MKPTKTPKQLFQEACKITGDDPNHLPYLNATSYREYRANCLHMLGIIEEAKNSDDPVKFRDGKWKWSAFFNVVEDATKPSGFGLSFAYSLHGYSDSHIGSRLFYMNSEKKSDEMAAECLPLLETIILKHIHYDTNKD